MDIREQHATARSDALAIVAKAKADGRGLTADEKAEVEQKFNRCKEIESLVATEKQFASLAIENEEVSEAIAVATKSFNKEKKMDNKTDKNEVNEIDALRQFARTGKVDFTLTSATNSGILMPTSIPQFYNVRQPANGFRKGYARLGLNTYNTGSVTDNMKIPTLDDGSNTANNNQEGAATGASADASTGSVSLNLVEYHGTASWFSKKVVNAQGFDVTAFALPQQLSRVERKEEIDWAAVLTADATIVGKTTAAATAVTLNELIDWDESLSIAFDGFPAFYGVSKGLRTAIRKLADSTNNPFFGVEGGIETLFGRPLVVVSNFGPMTTGQVVGALIVPDGAIIRDTSANELARYEGESGRPAQIGFEAIQYSAFGYVGGAVKTLKMA